MSQLPISPEDLVANAVLGDLHNWVGSAGVSASQLKLSEPPVSLVPNLGLKANSILGFQKTELPSSADKYIPKKHRVSLRLWFDDQEDYQGDAVAEMLCGLSLASHRIIVMCSGNSHGIQHRIICHADSELGVRNLMGGAFHGLHIEREEPDDFHTRVVDRMVGEVYFRHLLPSMPFWGSLSGHGVNLQAVYCTLLGLNDESYGLFQLVLCPVPEEWRRAVRVMSKAEAYVASRYPQQGPWTFSPDSARTAEEKLAGILFALNVRFAVFTRDEESNAQRVMTSLGMSMGGALFNGTALQFATEDDCQRAHIRRAQIQNLFLSGAVHREGIIVSHQELVPFLKLPSKDDLACKTFRLDRKPTLMANLGAESGIVLAHEFIFGKEVPVIWPRKQHTMHMIMSGATGHGKTVSVAGLAARIVEQPDVGLALMDPHDKAIELFVQCAPEARLEDMILHDPMDDKYVFCLPLFDCQNSDQIDAATSNITHQILSLTPRSEAAPNVTSVVHYVVRTILSSPNLALPDSKKLLDLTSPGYAFRERVCAELTDQSLIEYWENEFPYLTKDTIGRARNRFTRLTQISRLERFLANKLRKISHRQIIDDGKILLALTSPADAGIDLASTLGTIHSTGLTTAAWSRAGQEGKRRLFYKISDEFGNYANPQTISHSLRTLRKYDVAEILVTQNIERLPEEVKIAIGNINTHVVFKQGWDDAHRYFKEFCGAVPASDFLMKDVGEGYAKIGTRLAAISCHMPEVLRDVRVLEDIRDMTRKKYCVPIEEFRERMIEEKGASLDDMKNLDLL